MQITWIKSINEGKAISRHQHYESERVRKWECEMTFSNPPNFSPLSLSHFLNFSPSHHFIFSPSHLLIFSLSHLLTFSILEKPFNSFIFFYTFGEN